MAVAADRPALRRLHWPEYLIEAWALGTFMACASLCALALEHPASPLRAALPAADLRRALAGLAMGATAILLIHSPWGQRSGAHMNPAVTLAFLRLRRIAPVDALAFIVAQFLGGLAGVLLVWALAGSALAVPEVNFVATIPGPHGAFAALLAEFAISALLMGVVLRCAGHPALAPYTGLAAGVLVALFITFEAPVSGMSMNPARSIASALPAGAWRHQWIYLLAPVLGMQFAAWVCGPRRRTCAKLLHAADRPCMHCGQGAPRATNGGQRHAAH